MHEKQESKQKCGKYDAPYLKGYTHIGNSSKETARESIADYLVHEPRGTELIAEAFNPDNRTPSYEFWTHTVKWAVYKKVTDK